MTVGFIGLGNMGKAIIGGMLDALAAEKQRRAAAAARGDYHIDSL